MGRSRSRRWLGSDVDGSISLLKNETSRSTRHQADAAAPAHSGALEAWPSNLSPDVAMSTTPLQRCGFKFFVHVMASLTRTTERKSSALARNERSATLRLKPLTLRYPYLTVKLPFKWPLNGRLLPLQIVHRAGTGGGATRVRGGGPWLRQRRGMERQWGSCGKGTPVEKKVRQLRLVSWTRGAPRSIIRSPQAGPQHVSSQATLPTRSGRAIRSAPISREANHLHIGGGNGASLGRAVVGRLRQSGHTQISATG
jgi:hypothetical protein